jgi:hypothetical protein
MKKAAVLVVVFLGVLFSSSLANAAIVQCGVNPIPYATWSTWTSTGTGCEITDKIFQNFSLPGTAGTTGIPSDTQIQFTQAGNQISINFGNFGIQGFANSFTVSYNVTVDHAFNPDGTPNTGGTDWRINRVAAGLVDASANVNSVASITKACAPACSPSPSATANGNGTISQVSGAVAQAMMINVTDTYAFTSGLISNVTNTFAEAAFVAPEPSTFMLLGGALVAIGLFSRRRR